MLRKFFTTLVVFSLLNINCAFAKEEDEGDEQLRGIPLRSLSSPDPEKQLENQVGLIQTRTLEQNEEDTNDGKESLDAVA